MMTETFKQQRITGIELKPYTLKQLSELYGVCSRTFRKWLQPIMKEIGERKGYFYNITQVKVILNHLGLPGTEVLD